MVNYFFKKYKFRLLCLAISVYSLVAQAVTPITIYTAKKIITMDSVQPEATAVAVKDNKIYSVGSLEDMKAWMKPGSYTVDTQFQNAIMTPGFIEAHSHWTMLTLFELHPYVGYWNFPGENGAVLAALKSKAAVIEHLKQEDKKLTNPSTALFAWGYDPIFLNNENLTADDLDSISKIRPIFVLNASEHIGYVNHVLLNKIGYNTKTKIPGIGKEKNGELNGVLDEALAMGPALYAIYNELFTAESFKKSLYGMADTAHRLGLTTVSELLFGGSGEKEITTQLKASAKDKRYPLRTVLVYNGFLLDQMEKKKAGLGLSYINKLKQNNSNNLRFDGVKFISDGSIQGFTARLNWPGYFNGAPDGLFNMTTEEMKLAALPFWKAGIPIHVHANGDEATDSVLTVLAYLQNKIPRKNNIFVLEHDQMSTPEQFQKAHDLGAYVNLFSNHLYYWGDQHFGTILGPDRANRMDDAAEAKRHGLIFSLHTDSPVTPLGPLHSMWAAMNRMTVSGRVLGPEERISAEDALRAVTLNAAYLLNLQNEVGSIKIGKQADFTILARDPLTEPALTVKDIPVVATVQEGGVFLVF